MTALTEKLNRYSFVVNMDANKVEIKKAVESMYGVTVTDVNTMIIAGKNKSRYTKTGIIEGRTSAKKKAIITLADGDVIDFYSNI